MTGPWMAERMPPMMYLLEPCLAMWWSRQPAALWLAQARTSGYDLAQLDDWTRADRPGDDVTIRLALRHGVACSRGLVLDGGVASLQLVPQPTQASVTPPRTQAAVEIDPREKLARTLEAARRKSGLADDLTAQPPAPPAAPPGCATVSTDGAAAADPELLAALRPQPDEAALRGWLSLGGVVPAPP